MDSEPLGKDPGLRGNSRIKAELSMLLLPDTEEGDTAHIRSLSP